MPFANNNPILYVDRDGADYGVYMDEEKGTITIRATIYTGTTKTQEQAQRMADLMNAKSGYYSVLSEDQKTSYKIVFDVKVEMVGNTRLKRPDEDPNITMFENSDSKNKPKERAKNDPEEIGNSFDRDGFSGVRKGREITSDRPNYFDDSPLVQQAANQIRAEKDVNLLFSAMGVKINPDMTEMEKVTAVLTYASQSTDASNIDLSNAKKEDTKFGTEDDQSKTKIEYTNQEGKKEGFKLKGSVVKTETVPEKK